MKFELFLVSPGTCTNSLECLCGYVSTASLISQLCWWHVKCVCEVQRVFHLSSCCICQPGSTLWLQCVCMYASNIECFSTQTDGVPYFRECVLKSKKRWLSAGWKNENRRTNEGRMEMCKGDV